MSEPKVSLIVPVYNAEQYLEECLDSILGQTLKEIEVICVNDGSKDGSQKILEQYAAKDTRIRVVKQENAGQSGARNRGLQLATGQYIAFVDSDDFIRTDMLELLVLRADNTASDITIGDLLLYDENTKKTATYRDQKLYLYLKNKVFTLEQQPKIINAIGVWDRIYRRSFLDDVHASFPEGLTYEDHLYCIQTALYAKRITLVPEHFYFYRKNAGQSITDREVQNDKFKSDFLEINRRIQGLMDKFSISEDLRREYLSYFMFNAAMHQRNATTHSFFNEFFNQVCQMLKDKDYEIISTLDYELAVRYGKWLKTHNCSACRRYFLLRRHFYRKDGRIHFRLTTGEKRKKVAEGTCGYVCRR